MRREKGKGEEEDFFFWDFFGFWGVWDWSWSGGVGGR